MIGMLLLYGVVVQNLPWISTAMDDQEQSKVASVDVTIDPVSGV
jgi:hypothetical protein